MPKNNFSRYTLGVVFILLVATALLIWFGVTSKTYIKQLEHHWQVDNKRAAESAYALSRIHKSFGYGGFIHNFKNLVLRRDLSRIVLIDSNLAETYAAIESYEQLSISPQQQDAIARFRMTVDLYAEKYALSKQLLAQGLTSEQIDVQVRVDDGPALQALEYLSRATLDDSRTTNNEIGRDISRTLNFMGWGWLLVPLFVLLGSVVILMQRHLDTSNNALQNAKRYADDVLKAAPDALLVVDRVGEILSANVEAQFLFGYSVDELTGLNIERLMPERFRGAHSNYVNKSFELGRPQPMLGRRELVGLTKAGDEIPVEISLSYTSQNDEVHSIVAIRNISVRKQAERRLRLVSKVLDESSEGILITDRDTNIVDMNTAFCHLMGYGREEMLGKKLSMLSSGRHDQVFYQQMWQQLDTQGKWKGELWDRRKDGELIPNLVSISAVSDDAGQVGNYVAVFSDITQIKEKEQHLEQLAHFDGLTGLANRMLFHDRLRAALHRAHRHKNGFAVLYIDLDGFKDVNDRLGHAVGDDVLVRVARQIEQAIREDDTAARLGGDEFAIIFNELSNKDDADLLAARVLNSLTFEVNVATEVLPISASIGIALYPDHGDTVEALLHCADQAMYYCKRHGKKGYRRFSNEMADLSGK